MDNIRKVMDLRDVKKRDRSLLFAMLQSHLHEQAELAGHPQPVTQDIYFPDFKNYSGDDVTHAACILEHESEIAGFILRRYQPASDLDIPNLGAARVLSLAEVFLKRGHRGEGVSRFILEQMFEEAVRKRIPMTWTSLQADTESIRHYDRFCRWAIKHKGCSLQRLELTDSDGVPRFRYVLSLH